MEASNDPRGVADRSWECCTRHEANVLSSQRRLGSAPFTYPSVNPPLDLEVERGLPVLPVLLGRISFEPRLSGSPEPAPSSGLGPIPCPCTFSPTKAAPSRTEISSLRFRRTWTLHKRGPKSCSEDMCIPFGGHAVPHTVPTPPSTTCNCHCRRTRSPVREAAYPNQRLRAPFWLKEVIRVI
jgi:hypothetical protein